MSLWGPTIFCIKVCLATHLKIVDGYKLPLSANLGIDMKSYYYYKALISLKKREFPFYIESSYDIYFQAYSLEFINSQVAKCV